MMTSVRVARAIRSGEAGFTLLEMMIVAAILGVMAGSVVLGFVSFQRTSNFRNDRQLLASYLRSAQRYSLAYRRPICIKFKEATAIKDQTDFVEARFISDTVSCDAAGWGSGTTITGLGRFTPSSTVNIQMDAVGEDYWAISYTMTAGSEASIHMSDDLDSANYTDSNRSKYYTFTLVSTAGRVEVFPCGRNAPFLGDYC